MTYYLNYCLILDEDVKNRTTYFYKLEDIDIYDTSTMHRPVSAELKRIAR